MLHALIEDFSVIFELNMKDQHTLLMPCPCGANNSFKHCCLKLINQEALARSPEQLMRSRFSAYATNAAEYIFNTYAKSSQASQSLNDIEDWAKQTIWLKLIIHSASDFLMNQTDQISKAATFNKNSESCATVCFSAYYRHQGLYFLMKETSRFVLENNQWRYLDGKVSDHEELMTPKRNELCFCHSKKKFKRCCGA